MSTTPHPNGASRLIPIIGDPIKYVESPVTLTATFVAHGYNAVCIPVEVPEAALTTVLSALSAIPNVDGLLVTKPHKFTVTAHCATISEHSRLLGAVAVMRRNADGSWHGDTTDGASFVKAQIDRGARIEGARALLIGAGGAGSAIAIELVDKGVREIVIHDVDDSRAETLRDLLSGLGGASVAVGSSDPTGFDLVFSASGLGMSDDDPLPLDPSLLRAHMFVGDVVAGHGVTRFIAAAQAAGCQTASGSDMVNAAQELMTQFFVNGAELR